ncbi:MAG: hypothetical protein ACRC2T_14375, partial [Thermoguttaceae bacterium]
ADSQKEPITFSMQSQQYADTSNGIVLLDKCWSILGPTDTTTENNNGDDDENNKDKNVEIDRLIWFNNIVPDTHPDKDRIFKNKGVLSNDGKNAAIRPNEYMVVAPRVTTPLGSMSGMSAGGTLGKPTGEGIDLRLPNNPLFPGGANARTKVLVAAMDPPASWSNAQQTAYLGNAMSPGIGINISAPLSSSSNYYKEPTHQNDALKDILGVNVSNLYGDGSGNTYINEPFDNPDAKDKDNPLAEDEMIGIGTVPMVRTAMLQRVADPNRPYHQITNPYITVDWNMMDLTVFNGITYDKDVDTYRQIKGDNEDKDKYGIRLSSRQWGRTGLPDTLKNQLRNPNPWMRTLDPGKVIDPKSDQLDKSEITGSDVSQYVLSHRPQHALGRLNWMPIQNGINVTPPPSVHRGETIDGICDVNPSATGYYIGSPLGRNGIVPFVNHVWNDSPLANPYVVMQVPASSPGRFGLEFVDTGTEKLQVVLPTFENKAKDYALTNNNKGVGSLGSGGRYGYPTSNNNVSGLGHQLNFLHSSGNYIKTSNGKGRYEPKNFSMNLGEFLDHVQVPSRFVGTKLWLDPTNQPFEVSLNQEPGKINLNTVAKPTFTALMNGRDVLLSNAYDSSGTYDVFNVLSQSRQFADGLDQDSRMIPGDFAFDQPFRSFSSHNLMSPLNIEKPTEYPSIFESSKMKLSERGFSPAQNTLLRSINERSKDNDSSKDKFDPLFVPKEDNYTSRSTEEKLEGLERLSNIITTRSNVFAVWITVGYFEAETADPNQMINPITGKVYNLNDKTEKARFQAIYPDGYRLGRELGSDTGDTVRHRSFYTVDRTVPVGFRRGEKLNAWDTVILKRNIE